MRILVTGDRIFLDISKARQLLGWIPATNLQDGARSTVRYFQEKYHAPTIATVTSGASYSPGC